MTTPFRTFSVAVVILLFAAGAAQAQLELKAGNFNSIFVPQTAAGAAAAPSGPPVVASPAPTANQFSAMGQVSGSAGPISTSASLPSRYPSSGGASPIVLVRATFGGTFASGVPRYFMGDIILPPLVKADGITPASPGYWRVQPVAPGEILNPYYTGGVVTVGTPIPQGTVNVTASSTTSTELTVASVPAELMVGATILGQPITKITGSAPATVTIAGFANQTISSSTPVPITPALSYYYSPHAERVYASQPGRVTVMWVSNVVTSNGGYETRLETFAVASSTQAPVRTIFWTGGSFDGPRVNVADARITAVNPAYYSLVPKAVPQEVSIPGFTPQIPNLTTLSFERYNGVGQFNAYNVEGRIFVEYLGNVRLAGNIYESLGFDIVDIVRAPPANFATVRLGREITPHDGNSALSPSPVLSGAQNAASFYATNNRPDGTQAYFAERATSAANLPDNGSPASNQAYNKVVFYWLETGDFGIKWPKFQDRYWLRWSPDLSDYAHNTVDAAGSLPETGIAFTSGVLPQLVYQDDPNEIEARIDPVTQRFYVNFAAGGDLYNRSLLKFSSNGKLWYVNVYTQAETRQTSLLSTSTTVNGTTTITVNSTAGLEVGMIVSGPGITGTARIVTILDGTHFVLSQTLPDGTTPLTYTVESDASAPINATAIVGTRLSAPSGHENAGYLSAGKGYYPAGYLNPMVVGVTAAGAGAIIPVNALPTDSSLTVRWFKKVSAPSADFEDLYVPGKIGRYAISYPATSSPQIVIAKGVGTDDLPAAEAAGTIYVQNNPALPGYNPNEEHALILGGRAYALREDLNVTSGAGYTSQPFVLVAYTNPVDNRPSMHAYQVLRTNATYDFDYVATAGTLLQKPYPLPLLPLPLVGPAGNRTSKDLEIAGADQPANTSLLADPAYTGFTFRDRKGFTWVHRGPHAGSSPVLTMKLYYLSQAGFYLPGAGEPTIGTILPFLRNPARSGQPLNITAIDQGQSDEPLAIRYHPEWPSNAPALQVGETLTLPKFGLPQVRGQASAEVFYQQSLATAPGATLLTKNSVTLHDPTREKIIAFDAPGVGLTALPAAIKSAPYQGKTYFQGIPPHLQRRLYLDPARGAKGTLVLRGAFHDEVAGEDYLDLNLLTAAEEVLVKNLVPIGAADKTKWDAAIDALNTRVETFKPNPAQLGAYIVDPTKNQDAGENDLAIVTSSNTAVDSYAVTATGKGTGFVTMVMGNGRAFTPEGDPVQVQVFKIANQLYTGDLKALLSSNPLDEQVTLRHSGDFAGKPNDYEFEWRWASGSEISPAVYTSTLETRIGNPGALPTPTNLWTVARDPGARLPSPAQYAAAGSALSFPRSENVSPVNYVLDAQGQPTSTIITASSYTAADAAAGYPSLVLKSGAGVNFTGGVPGTIVFSANLGEFDGCVLYVNGVVALAHNVDGTFFASTNASSGISPVGLTKQFSIAPSFFSAGPNTVEVAIYTTASPNAASALDFHLDAAQETDAVVTGNIWQTPGGQNATTGLLPYAASVVVGGPPGAPFGGTTFVLNDRWFTLRYRPKAGANNVLGTPWSRWLPPQFVGGWVKRVLSAINPFEQRVTDLFNNEVNTDLDVLTQAGTRWEGDIALTLENVNNVGLISIYETLLNRASDLSINANTNDPDSNNALVLAAGYLHDLYTLLGNEAYADAANPTISLDDQTTVTEVNTSRFSFEGQVTSSLEEELSLLRGRDDLLSPGVRAAPAYNRLYWNYTQGINSGEVLYAVNYNIKEKAGSSTANGVVDAADAQRIFPQGHGDAYGHYLTALTGYYRLLANPNFTWSPRAETVTVLGQPVTVDYFDERKFASAAGNVARTAQQVAGLVYRKTYTDNPGAGWSSYRDQKGVNPATGVTSRQGLDEWVSRGAQGALYHWAVANALVPEQDDVHSGVQKIDRSTVPELSELPSLAASFQSTIDNANAHLTPLGLSPGAIAFDLSPGDLMAGHSHFEQVSSRAVTSLVNAVGAFNQAAKMTRSLRNQQNQIDDYNTVIVAQETAYLNQLIDIFGRPYSGEVAPGKLYAEGYNGPDLFHWFIVDRPTDLVDTSKTFTVSIQEPVGYVNLNGYSPAFQFESTWRSILSSAPRTVTVQPAQMVQYNDVWQATGLGSRPETGELQAALQDAQASYLAIAAARQRYLNGEAKYVNAINKVADILIAHQQSTNITAKKRAEIESLTNQVLAKSTEARILGGLGDLANALGQALVEPFPTVVGTSYDATSPLRAIARYASYTATIGFKIGEGVASGAASKLRADVETTQGSILDEVRRLGFAAEEEQLAYEFDQVFREYTSHAQELMQLALTHQRALQQVSNTLAKGERLLADREVFRQRAAAIIQGYRTKDLSFRLFRNEALEQYRSLFDLASRYSYLAAKSYDYETGLLGSASGQMIFKQIVGSRSLGDLTGGVPQATTSTLGDAGLAGVMARLNADFSVAEGRLGINNPDRYGTVFSLRGELYRIRADNAVTADDDAWRQTLEQHIMANVLTDPDVATHCRNLRKPDGSPVPGIVISFGTTIQHGKNFFGIDLAAGDHSFTPSNFATKIYSVGIALPGYIGMDAYATGNPAGGAPSSSAPHALSATPYVYLIPCGSDFMLAPTLGDTNSVRSWSVHDQALPLPYNLGATAFNTTQFFNANGTLSEQPWVLRKHQAFRAVSDATFFYSTTPAEFTNSRLIARSVWNGQWKIVIPAYTLLNDEQAGLDGFVATVRDVQLFLRTYSNSGN